MAGLEFHILPDESSDVCYRDNGLFSSMLWSRRSAAKTEAMAGNSDGNNALRVTLSGPIREFRREFVSSGPSAGLWLCTAKGWVRATTTAAIVLFPKHGQVLWRNMLQSPIPLFNAGTDIGLTPPAGELLPGEAFTARGYTVLESNGGGVVVEMEGSGLCCPIGDPLAAVAFLACEAARRKLGHHGGCSWALAGETEAFPWADGGTMSFVTGTLPPTLLPFEGRNDNINTNLQRGNGNYCFPEDPAEYESVRCSRSPSPPSKALPCDDEEQQQHSEVSTQPLRNQRESEATVSNRRNSKSVLPPLVPPPVKVYLIVTATMSNTASSRSLSRSYSKKGAAVPPNKLWQSAISYDGTTYTYTRHGVSCRSEHVSANDSVLLEEMRPDAEDSRGAEEMVADKGSPSIVVLMGESSKWPAIADGAAGAATFHGRVEQLAHAEFSKERYDPATNNCHVFCEVLLLLLLGEPSASTTEQWVPRWVASGLKNALPSLSTSMCPNGKGPVVSISKRVNFVT